MARCARWKIIEVTKLKPKEQRGNTNACLDIVDIDSSIVSMSVLSYSSIFVYGDLLFRLSCLEVIPEKLSVLITYPWRKPYQN